MPQHLSHFIVTHQKNIVVVIAVIIIIIIIIIIGLYRKYRHKKHNIKIKIRTMFFCSPKHNSCKCHFGPFCPCKDK